MRDYTTSLGTLLSLRLIRIPSRHVRPPPVIPRRCLAAGPPSACEAGEEAGGGGARAHLFEKYWLRLKAESHEATLDPDGARFNCSWLCVSASTEDINCTPKREREQLTKQVVRSA